ncbi:MAG: Holliday junction branch migration protein RuvA [Chlamydiota bacterium]
MALTLTRLLPMFTHIKGILTSCSPLFAIIETGGIGYKIFIPASVYSQLPKVGEKVHLHTSFVVRELSQTLYGFTSDEERDIFEVLLGVSGVGPKTALSIIGHLSTHNLYEAIANNDIPKICKVPGIGKKSAERLMIEIRDKLPSLFPAKPSQFAVDLKNDPHSQLINDAMSALINLGYNQNTSEKAIKKTMKDQPDTIELAQLITLALKNV